MNSPGNAELGEFLRTRRSQLDPGEAGIPESTRRRVPGLRRQELAQLASISPDYYTRLEQGRHLTASPGVLDALARALLLSTDERAHLYALAQAVDPEPPDDSPATDRAEALEGMLAVFGSVPAVLCGAFSDILAANDAARFLYGTDFGALPAPERNSIHWMLTSPAARALYDECWEQTATEMIGKLRAETGKRPRHPRARALVEQLDLCSDLFRQVWAQHEISDCVQGVKTLRHAAAGVLRMRTDAVTMYSSPSQVFYVMFPASTAFETAYRKHAQSPDVEPLCPRAGGERAGRV
jgi:transcriptional regulator with XRE-family HTH domain